MAKNRVKVVIPIYTESLKGYDEYSLINNVKILSRYPIAILAPEGLNISAITCLIPPCEEIRVSPNWLGTKGIAGYNDMMLSRSFYELFSDCEYILICQTDAWIFQDELEQWCKEGYDYVGAPWPKRNIYNNPLIKSYLKLRNKYFRRDNLIIRQDYFNKIGNGGLSLRRIEACINACDKYQDVIEIFKAKRGMLYNEDWFWALIPDEFKYPTLDRALEFSFDVNPERCYRLANKKLPFGCHGWFKKRNISFWLPKIMG